MLRLLPHARVVAVGVTARVTAFTMGLLVASTLACSEEPFQPAAWREVQAPQVWKNPPGQIDKEGNGFAWFRCRARLPAAWKGRQLAVYAEASDDARAFFVNATQVGQFGSFPPAYRSGLGQEQRFPAPDSAWQAGDEAVISVRLFQKEARSNFNIAPVILLAGDQAIRLEGAWQMRVGDSEHPPLDHPGGQAFADVLDAATAYLQRRKLEGEVGPLPPLETLQHLSTPADLEVEVCAGGSRYRATAADQI